MGLHGEEYEQDRVMHVDQADPAKREGGLDVLNANLSKLSDQIDLLLDRLGPVLGREYERPESPSVVEPEPDNELRACGERAASISRRLSRLIDRIDL